MDRLYKAIGLLNDLKLSFRGTVFSTQLDKRVEEIAEILYDVYSDGFRDTEFFIRTKAMDGELVTISDESFSLTQIQNLRILQPLSPISEERMEGLLEALNDALKPTKDELVLVVPFDVKALQVVGIVPKMKRGESKTNDTNRSNT